MTEQRQIVLIHGLWITAEPWQPWVDRYAAAGHQAHALPWPRMGRTADEIRNDPGDLAGLTIGEVVDHLAAQIAELDRPILIGHSFGGALVQLLLDRGLGAAGVALQSAGVRGVRKVTLDQLRVLGPALVNPRNRKGLVPTDEAGFLAYAANALDPDTARAAFARDIVPAPGRFVFDMALANAVPRTPLRVNLKNKDRAPLLFIGAAADRMASPAFNKANARLQARSGAVTAYREFPGRSHYVGQADWEPVADFALEWALNPTSFGIR